MNTRININTNPGPKTAVLSCAHCKIDHKVEPRDRAKYEAVARQNNLPLEKVWWCGRCYLEYINRGADKLGQPRLELQVDCPEHHVPEFPEESHV